MLDYAKALNSAQHEAVTSGDGPVLVVAGAGSGKTRTIVYRLAWLVEHGVFPNSILLLTFTRKAAHEMLSRSANLLGRGLGGISGGTFHSFAFGALRRFPPDWLEGTPFTLMDSSDITQAVRRCREKLQLGKKDSSFPKTQSIISILSKARNKEISVEEVLRGDAFHLLPYADALAELDTAYAAFRKEKKLLDYDDLLFELEKLLASEGYAANALRARFKHVLVDEYQDTNLVQARIVRLLAGQSSQQDNQPEFTANVMAVGDEAQSIYAFRGANVRNILDFPKLFPGARVIRLEENYRSTQPILDIANSILVNAAESYRKKLFTQKSGGEPVRIITPLSDTSEAALVVERIKELKEKYPPHEIAVLFRAGFHSYLLESALRQCGIAFRKYGGLRFIEAAHIKDVLSFARMSINPFDLPAFDRIASMHKGVGPKTVSRLHNVLGRNDSSEIRKEFGRYPELLADLEFIDCMRVRRLSPENFFEKLLEYYRPRLEKLYPDDWPGRLQGLDEIAHMAQNYESLDLFVADMALEAPDEAIDEDVEDCITLSTVHSAKGLEWNAVLILDVVEDRFPSRHAQTRPEDFEEERRLFYVACTRARHTLEFYAPATVFSRAEHDSVYVARSPFLQELEPGLAINLTEKYGGRLVGDSTGKRASKSGEKAKIQAKAVKHARDIQETPSVKKMQASGNNSKKKACMPKDAGYCRHRIFGRGKIIRYIDDDKAQVNFPGFGLKVILVDYLMLGEE